MARATTRTQTDTPPEADRLGGWPHPREVQALHGHDEALAELRHSFAGRHMAHGWLISGPQGIGKATLAYHFAAEALSAGEPAENPAQASHSRRQIAALSHPGLFVLRRPWDPQGKRFKQVITVEDIRRLRHFLTSTAGSRWRVVIVDSADDLNVSSANALLKSLEEPPPRTLFFLLASSGGVLPATLMSRCARLRMRPLEEPALRQAVEAAHAAIGQAVPPAEEMDAVLGLAAGSPRRALELLSGDGVELGALISAALKSLPRVDFSAVHRLIALAGAPRAQQAEALFFALLQAKLHGAIRTAALAAPQHGQTGAPGAAILGKPLIHPQALALWGELWETISQMRAGAERLNLHKGALILELFVKIEQVAWRSLSSG